VREQLALLPGFLNAHLELVLPALAVALLLSVPLGIAVTRRRRLEPAVLGIASVIQTIPSLALLAIMVPALAVLGGVTAALFGFELRSIGYAPAFVALSLYGVLPILRNTVAGIDGVDPALVEAAQGVGMTSGQQLRHVELPLALPVIVAGARTAAVWVVGIATLSTPVGATSLGNYIFSGLQTRNFDAVLVGCIAAAALAMALDQLIALLESGVRARSRVRIGIAAAALAGLLLWSLGSLAAGRLGATTRPIAIGSKTFTEQYILSELLAQRIATQTGLATTALQSLGSTVAFDALRTSDLDLYVDYSGTIWATIMKRATLPERRLGISSIDELTGHAPRLEIGGDYEFFQRAEWKALVDRYGLAFRRERSMDPALMYQAVAEKEVDVISAYSTDGRIVAYDLMLLADDRGVIPPYDAIILASPRLAAAHPDVIAAFTPLLGAIDAATMQHLNLAVDRDRRTPAAVAAEFLETLHEPH
jgi:osmoprotectant transport system permease protein